MNTNDSNNLVDSIENMSIISFHAKPGNCDNIVTVQNINYSTEVTEMKHQSKFRNVDSMCSNDDILSMVDFFIDAQDCDNQKATDAATVYTKQTKEKTSTDRIHSNQKKKYEICLTEFFETCRSSVCRYKKLRKKTLSHTRNPPLNKMKIINLALPSHKKETSDNSRCSVDS